MKPTKQLKKVKIDDHIKKARSSGNKPTPVRGRGRPRKNTEFNGNPDQAQGSGLPPSELPNVSAIEANIDASQSTEVVPEYDTTEEAKGFIRTPFDIAAGITGIQDLALYPAQLEALAPSFKIVYDRRIKPYLGENADLYAFLMVFAGVAAEKVSVFKKEVALRKAAQQPNKTVDANGAPIIPTEHVQ